MLGSVFVDPGDAVPLDRQSLSAPPLASTSELLEYCAGWAADVGWSLAFDITEADAIVVGPGVAQPAHPGPVLAVERAQGVDGFRWAIRHLGYSAQWPFDTIPYGLIDDQLMDVRRPRRQPPRGAVVLVHGGFWMQAWRRDLMDGLAVDLAERGFETWNIEYGRVGGTGGWPRSRDDVVSALDRVVEESSARPLVVVGHSAGAQLALTAAALRPESIDLVVSLAGLCDLDSARTQRLGGGAVDRLLDGAPVEDASPLDQVPLAVPVVLAHCEGDSVVPLDLSQRYAEAAHASHAEVTFLALPEGDHMSLIEPDGAWREVLPTVMGAASRG